MDQNYIEGISPIEDVEVLENISPLPLQYGNGQFINDPAPLRRGPYADADASHAFVESPFHRSSDMCGICHDLRIHDLASSNVTSRPRNFNASAIGCNQPFGPTLFGPTRICM